MKTPPILLKLLHNSAAKPSPKFNNTASRKNEAGYTIIELLIIVLILGIFASIAAPSWLAFINRQRVRTVNDRVFQSLRTAQSEAKRSKRDVTVTFNYDPNPPANPVADPPTVTIDTNPAELDPSKKEIRKETFSSGGEIKPRTIVLATNATSITFDYQGNPSTTPFVVTVAPANSKPDTSARQCARVETLIGGMRTAEGNDCPPLPTLP